MRWELNDLARRLDNRMPRWSFRNLPFPRPRRARHLKYRSNTGRILESIENLPEEERKVFNLVRIQGLTLPEAADILIVSAKTVQRRLNRGLMLLSEKVGDLQPAPH